MELMFVVFVLGTSTVRLTADQPDNIVVDINTGRWHEENGDYAVNTGVREPGAGENHEYWGTMMVLATPPGQPLNLNEVRRAMEELHLTWAPTEELVLV
jgi:hypothetical protein